MLEKYLANCVKKTDVGKMPGQLREKN